MIDKEYADLESWLKNKELKTLLKYWKVVSIIESKQELSDEHSFLYHTIDFQDIDRNDLVDVLTNLHKKDFIFVGMKLGETPKNDQGLPMASVWEDITDKPDEVLGLYSTRTEIQIQHKFKHLISALRPLIADQKVLEGGEPKQSTNGIGLNLSLPEQWNLEESDGKGLLTKDGKVLYIFPNLWAQKYKFFKCLCNNYGQHVSYKELLEYESNLKYPEKKVTNINRNIRSIINKLRKDFKKLSIHIETSKGFTLTLQ